MTNNKFATLLTLIATMSRNQIRTKTRPVASNGFNFWALPNPPEAERVGLSAISFFRRGGGHPECSDEIGMYRRTTKAQVNEKRMPLQSLTRLIPQGLVVANQFPLLKGVPRNEAGDFFITSSLHHLIA